MVKRYLEHPDTLDALDRATRVAMYEAAIFAAAPYEAIKANLPRPPKGRIIVLSGGETTVTAIT